MAHGRGYNYLPFWKNITMSLRHYVCGYRKPVSTITNKKLSWWWETCATAYTISSGGRKSIGNCRTAVSYAEGVLTYRQAAESYSAAIAQRYQTENIKVHPSDKLPFPLEFRNNNAVLENHSGRATRPRKKFDHIFSRLDTIPGVWQTFRHPDTLRQQRRAMHICVAQ